MTTIVADSYEGDWAAQTEGNIYIEQSFDPISAAQLATASFWAWHDGEFGALTVVNWFHSDGTEGQHVFSPLDVNMAGWVELDLLPHLDPDIEIVLLRVWGYITTEDVVPWARFDQFEFCASEGSQ